MMRKVITLTPCKTPNTFDSEDEAVIFGLAVARAWITNKL
jgi:hypothetical protein